MDATTVFSATFTLLVLLAFVAATAAFYYLSIFIHEVGHLLAARIVGWRPLGLCMGSGTRRPVFRIGDLQFEVGSRPVSGFAFACARHSRRFRPAQFFFALGGPIATGCVALGLGLAAMNIPGAGLLGYFCFLECWLLAGVLWPHLTDFDGEQIPSDGLLIWRTLWMSPREVRDRYIAHVIHLCSVLLKRGHREEACYEYGKLRSTVDDAAEDLQMLTCWVHLLLAAGLDHEAREDCDRLIRGEHAVAERVRMLDSLASLPIFYGHRGMIADALAFIERAIEEAPDQTTLHGTRGSLLVEHGRLDEGMEILDHVKKTSDSESDQAIVAWYLALGHHKQGRAQQADESLAVANQNYPGCIVAKRIVAEIAASPLENKIVSIGVP